MIFYQKLLWNIRSRLNSSTFWAFEPVFRYVWSKLKLCAQKIEDFDQIYLNTGSNIQNVEKLSLDLRHSVQMTWTRHKRKIFPLSSLTLIKRIILINTSTLIKKMLKDWKLILMSTMRITKSWSSSSHVFTIPESMNYFHENFFFFFV